MLSCECQQTQGLWLIICHCWLVLVLTHDEAICQATFLPFQSQSGPPLGKGSPSRRLPWMALINPASRIDQPPPASVILIVFTLAAAMHAACLSCHQPCILISAPCFQMQKATSWPKRCTTPSSSEVQDRRKLIECWQSKNALRRDTFESRS